ncbi:MAG: hypothetical protein WC788_02640 [Candidatus Paceibacterota bacterium]|jgi:hypothetical protein
MFEELTFSERLERNLKLNSWGILKPRMEISVLLREEGSGNKYRNLQDCCFRFIQLRKENRVTGEVLEKIEKLKIRIKERIDFLTRDLREDEDQFLKEGTYKDNYSELRNKYYEVLSWRSALETFNEREFKALNTRKFIQTKVDDAKGWNDFLKGVGAANGA